MLRVNSKINISTDRHMVAATPLILVPSITNGIHSFSVEKSVLYTSFSLKMGLACKVSKRFFKEATFQLPKQNLSEVLFFIKFSGL
jgi:hypothetical protein